MKRRRRNSNRLANILKEVIRWLLVLACLGAIASCGVLSITGFMGLVVGVLALPFRPVSYLWKKILPPGSPRFAKGAILAAGFLVAVAATPGQSTRSSVYSAATPVGTPGQTESPAITATPSPAPTEIPEQPSGAEAETPDASAVPTAETGAPASAIGEEDTVYIAASGKGTKYHTDPTCSQMESPVALTRSEAEAQGYSPCKRCCQ